MAIVYRNVLGVPLSFTQLDNNFFELDARVTTNKNNIDLILGKYITTGSALASQNILGTLTITGTFKINSLATATSPTRIVTYNSSTYQLDSYPISQLLNIGGGYITTGSAGTSQTIKGSLVINEKLTVTGGITGSLFGTASWAKKVLTASRVENSLTQGTGITTFTYNGSAATTVAVSGAAQLTNNIITKWNSTSGKFIDSSLTDSGTTITGASSIQLTGASSRLTGSFSGSFYGNLFPSLSVGNYTNFVVYDSSNKKLYYTSSISSIANTVGFITTGSSVANQAITGSLTISGSTVISGSLYYSASSGNYKNYIVIDTGSGKLFYSSTPGGSLGGSGTTNYIARWTPDGTTLGNSILFESASRIGVGLSPIGIPDATLQVNGGIVVGQSGSYMGQSINFIRPTDGALMTGLSVPSAGTLKLGGGNQQLVEIYCHTELATRFDSYGPANANATYTQTLVGPLFVSGSQYTPTHNASYMLLVTGSGKSGSANINNVLYVTSSNVGINISNPTGALDVKDQITIHSTNSNIPAKLVYYTGADVPWSTQIVPSSNRFGLYAPRAVTNNPIKIIELGDYVDAFPPNLVFGGGGQAVGYPHYWGINMDIMTGLWPSSSFAVKQYATNPYASTIVDSSDKVVSGFNQLGGAYFSGSVGIGTKTPAYKLDVTGSTTSVARIQGSGSANPLFLVQGSQGELFSVTDNLSGSLFSVNDISGLPIIEVFSDSTTLIGNYIAPSLNTTVKTTIGTGTGVVIYQVPTSSYDGMYVDYVVKSGSVARVGNILTTWTGSGGTTLLDTSTSIGTTTAFTFNSIITGSNFALTGSATTAGWTVKTIIRSI